MTLPGWLFYVLIGAGVLLGIAILVVAVLIIRTLLRKRPGRGRKRSAKGYSPYRGR